MFDLKCNSVLRFFSLLEELDMELVFVRKFPEALQHWKSTGAGLLTRMQARGFHLNKAAFSYICVVACYQIYNFPSFCVLEPVFQYQRHHCNINIIVIDVWIM